MSFRRTQLILGVVFASLLGFQSARAAVWTNRALNDSIGGNQGAQTSLINEEDPGRWHQNGIDFDTTPGTIYFEDPTTSRNVRFIRFWNWTDPASPGPVEFRFQSLNGGGNPNLDADWTDIPGTLQNLASSPQYFQ